MQESLSDIKRKTVSGLFWRFSERILAQTVNVMVSIVLARVLLPEAYSVVCLVTIFINLANVFVTNGLGTALIQKKDVDTIDYSTVFFGGFGFSIVLYLVIFLISPLIANIYHNDIICPMLRVMGLRLPLAAINSVQQAYVSREMIFRKFFLATLLGTVISAFIGIWMARNEFGAWALAGQYLSNAIIDTLILSFTVKWHPEFVFSPARFKELFSYGWKLMVTGFLGTLFDQLRSLLIGIKYTVTDLSFSNQGERIPLFVANNVNATIDSVFFSAIAKLQEDASQLKSAVRRVMKVSSFLITPLMFGLAAIADSLVLVLLGDAWLPCVPFMRTVCVQMCFSVLGMVNLQVIKAMGRSDIALKLEVIKKPIYFLCIFVAMFVSPLSMSVANMIYGFIALIVNANPVQELINYRLGEQFRDVATNYMASSIMVIIVLGVEMLEIPVGLSLLLQIIVGVVSYTLICKFMKNESYNYIILYIKNVLEEAKNV